MSEYNRNKNQWKIYKAAQEQDLSKGWKVITKAELEKVSARLHKTTPATVLMWLDLALNSDEYTPCLSGSDYANRLKFGYSGNGSDEYTRARNKLVQHGYLVPKGDGDYIFYRESYYDSSEEYRSMTIADTRQHGNGVHTSTGEQSEDIKTIEHDTIVDYTTLSDSSLENIYKEKYSRAAISHSKEAVDGMLQPLDFRFERYSRDWYIEAIKVIDSNFLIGRYIDRANELPF